MTEGLQPSPVEKYTDRILDKAVTAGARSSGQARTPGGSTGVPPLRAGTGAFAFMTGPRGRILPQVARAEASPRGGSPGIGAFAFLSDTRIGDTIARGKQHDSEASRKRKPEVAVFGGDRIEAATPPRKRIAEVCTREPKRQGGGEHILAWRKCLPFLQKMPVQDPVTWPASRPYSRDQTAVKSSEGRAKEIQIAEASPGESSAVSAPFRLPPRVPRAANQGTGTCSEEEIRSVLWKVYNEERQWMLDQKKFKWAATDSIVDRHARRRQAARLATIMRGEDVERVLGISLPEYPRGCGDLVESILETLVIRTPGHLAGIYGRHGHFLSFTIDSGFDPDRNGNFLGTDIARYLRSLGPASDPDLLFERAVDLVEGERRDGSSVRRTAKQQLRFLFTQMGGCGFAHVEAGCVDAVPTAPGRDSIPYEVLPIQAAIHLETIANDKNRSEILRGVAAGALLHMASGNRGATMRNMVVTQIYTDVGIAEGIGFRRKHPNSPQQLPVSFFVPLALFDDSEEKRGAWFGSWVSMMRGGEALCCAIRDFSGTNPEDPNCVWLNQPLPGRKLLAFIRWVLVKELHMSSKRANEFDVTSLRQFVNHVAAARGVPQEMRVELGAWSGGAMADARYVPKLPELRRHNLALSQMPDRYSRHAQFQKVMQCFKEQFAAVRDLVRLVKLRSRSLVMSSEIWGQPAPM